MINIDISKPKDIIEKNKICPFCKSNLSLSAEVPITKSYSGFKIDNNEIIFDVNPKYFNHAKINLEDNSFNIEKNAPPHNPLFVNYKNVSFQRTCHFCINNFHIKYTKFKYENDIIQSVGIDTIFFKFFVSSKKDDLYRITNNFKSNETIISKLTFVENYLYEISTSINIPLIEWDFDSNEKIYSKLESIILFY